MFHWVGQIDGRSDTIRTEWIQVVAVRYQQTASNPGFGGFSALFPREKKIRRREMDGRTYYDLFLKVLHVYRYIFYFKIKLKYRACSRDKASP